MPYLNLAIDDLKDFLMDLQSGVIAVLIVGFLLGLKHATDVDHVVAVSTIVSSQRNIWRSFWIGCSWGSGHSAPLIVLGIIILLLKDAALHRLETVEPYLELGVGVMLIYLGASIGWNLLRGKMHIHAHDHGNGTHVHVHASHSTAEEDDGDEAREGGFFIFGKPILRARSFVIGVVHGLAGSAAVMVALLPTIDSVAVGIGYLLIFSIGTMLSMTALTLVLAVPFKHAVNSQKLHRVLVSAAGAFSAIVGAILIAEITLDITILPI